MGFTREKEIEGERQRRGLNFYVLASFVQAWPQFDATLPPRTVSSHVHAPRVAQLSNTRYPLVFLPVPPCSPMLPHPLLQKRCCRSRLPLLGCD